MLPVVSAAIRARISGDEAQRRSAVRPLLRATMACPARTIAAIAAALLEVEVGQRPAAQLERLCHPTLWAALERRLRRHGGPAITCHSLCRVLVQEHRPGLVDGVALLERGARVEPVAMRLDGALGRWQLTELQYLPAAEWPAHGRLGR